jgi:hypothetical protein
MGRMAIAAAKKASLVSAETEAASSSADALPAGLICTRDESDMAESCSDRD